MKSVLLILFFPIFLSAQSDTIATYDGKIIVCKITLDNGLYMFYTDKKDRGESLEKTKIKYYVWNKQKMVINPPKGRNGFKWDFIIDSLANDKSILFSKTKLFIAEKWNSSTDVIKNDDKDAGILLLKGLTVIEKNYQMANHKWTFRYTITFMVKDSKCRIIIEDVHGEAASTSGAVWPALDVSTKYPGYSQTSVSEERYNDIIRDLTDDLQNIVNSYEIEMKKKSIKSEW